MSSSQEVIGKWEKWGAGGSGPIFPAMKGKGASGQSRPAHSHPVPCLAWLAVRLEGPSLWCECQVLFPELQLFPGHVRGCH